MFNEEIHWDDLLDFTETNDSTPITLWLCTTENMCNELIKHTVQDGYDYWKANFISSTPPMNTWFRSNFRFTWCSFLAEYMSGVIDNPLDIVWAVLHDNELVGYIMLQWCEDDKLYQLAIHTFKPHSNKKFAQRAVKLLLSNLDSLGLSVPIWWSCKSNNVVSKHLAQKCGFIQSSDGSDVSWFKR